MNETEPSPKPLLRVLGGQRTTPPPVWLMRQAGRYLPEYRAVRARAGDFLSLCYDPVLAAEVTLQPVRRFGLDAAILFSDILVIPDALGMKVAFREGEGPVLERLERPADVARLSLGACAGHLSPILETVRRVRRELDERTALIGFAGAPWTVATYMIEGGSDRDFVRTKSWAYGDPAGFAALIDVLVEATADYLIAQAEAGAEVLQLFDSWSGTLPDDAFQRWCIEPIGRIVVAVKARCPDVRIIGFPRGAGLYLDSYVASTGVDAVSLDTTVPLDYARDVLQPRVAVQGNLDPVALLLGGTALADATGRILKALGGGRLIFNLGHGVVPETPPQHVADLVALVRGTR